MSEYGVDIMDGANLYSCLTEFQLGIIEDMVDVAANEDNIRTAKEALVATYRRQYALPLLGNQRSLSKFEDLLSEICVESDAEWIKPEMLLEKFKRSEQLLQSRVLYEQNIISESFLSSSLGDQVTAWKTYIQFEIEDKQPARARRLFERSVIANHQSLELWQDFAEFAESTLKQWDVVESVACRALKVHHSNIDLWLQYFIAIESSKSNHQRSLQSHYSFNATNLKSIIAASGSSDSDDQKFTRAMEKALTCRFASADDYLAILLHSCDIRRRKLQKAVQSIPKDMPVQGTIALRSPLVNSVHATRNAFQRAESFLSTYYPDWCSGWLQVYKYEASVEDEIIADVAEMFENGPFASQSHSDSSDLEGVDPSKAGEVWERAVVRFSKYHYVWGEYIQWGRAAFDYDLCRNLYRRALKAVKDHVEETCKSYLLFEQQVGSLDDLCVARGRTKALLKNSKIRLRKAAEAAKEEAKAKALKRTKRNLPSVPVNHITSSTGSAINVEHASSCDDSVSTAQVNISGDKRVLEQQTVKERDFDLADNSVSETDHENEHGLRKRIKVDSDVKNAQGHSAVLSQSVKRSSEADDSNTICVKNLSFNSTIEDVLVCFKPCGEFNNAVLVLSKAGKSRGQAIIEFKERSSAADALLLKGSIIGERAIEVEMAPKHDFEEAAPGSSSKAPSTHHPTTVFVSKFPKTLTNADLKGLFIQCGSVIEARIMVDKRTGVSKVTTINIISIHDLLDYQLMKIVSRNNVSYINFFHSVYHTVSRVGSILRGGREKCGTAFEQEGD